MTARRASAALAALFLLSATAAHALPLTHRAQSRPNVDVAASVHDDDGDDDGYLTYSWQNPAYSHDEVQQSASILVFLGGVAIWSVLRGVARDSRRRNQEARG
jgi:hypothetical protein